MWGCLPSIASYDMACPIADSVRPYQASACDPECHPPVALQWGRLPRKLQLVASRNVRRQEIIEKEL
jgi:hypothetical protein